MPPTALSKLSNKLSGQYLRLARCRIAFNPISIFLNEQVVTNDGGLPAPASVTRARSAVNANCKGKLSADCRNAITAADQKVQFAITLINQGDIPACLRTHVTRYKGDLLSMSGGLQIALNGFKAGDKALVDQGLSQFQTSSAPLAEDSAAVANDLKVLCN